MGKDFSLTARKRASTKSWQWIEVLLIFGLALSGCSSPFAPIVLAPSPTVIIDSADKLPPSLVNKSILWNDNVVALKGSTVSLPDDASGFIRISDDNRWVTYSTASLALGEDVFPHIKEHYIVLYNLTTHAKRYMVRMKHAFPQALSLAAPTFTPNGKQVMFWVGWEHEFDLATVDIASGNVQRLNVNVTLTNFALPDVSPDGHIVVICQGPKRDSPASELCLLNSNGKFVRYLTAEDYPWPGYGRFTPDGQYIIYESHFRLYKVRADGTERQQIAPCSALFGPLLVTKDYAVTACYISKEPNCYALFVTSLDGKDFRRIGYIAPYCAPAK